ncbi:MFS general substrate transporter [Annulohypoxylon moriforme]|nr:MFS general substrate transporter [Annulohypoxylon moriforme]
MRSYIQYRQIGRDLRSVIGNDSKTTRAEDDVEKARGRCLPTPTSKARVNDQSAEKGCAREAVTIHVENDDGPLDPKNWRQAFRCKNVGILCFLIFTQVWSGAAESIANKTASAEFGVGQIAENLSTAIYLFGIGSGAFFAGPLSETIGRNPTYLASTFCYLFFVLGSASTPTFGGQIACRYFVGLFSSATLSINGSSVRDQFRPVKRAFAFPIIAWANVAAPAMAPIAGGWIILNSSLSWRWTDWMSGLALLVSFLFLPETYLPLLFDWKAKQLRCITGNHHYVSEHANSVSFTQRPRHVGPLSAKFLTHEPVIAVLGGYLILLDVLLFTYFLRHFFTLLAPGLYSWTRWKTKSVRGSSIDPEFRLWPAIVAAPLLPISIFWLGACFAFGMVIIAIYVSGYEYIIDSITMVRCLIAGSMVMAVRPMYEGICTHWTMTLLGCIAVILLPAPLVF